MTILYAEDDKLQSDSLEANLRSEFPDAELCRIINAKAFKARTAEFRAASPAIIIIDIMLPWQGTDEVDEPPPSELATSGYRHIGLHCQRWLAEDPVLRDIPVILYTELARSSLQLDLKELPMNVRYVRKDAGYATLNRAIRQLTKTGVEPESQSPSYS